MSFSRTLFVLVLAVSACGPALEEPALSLSPERSSFDGKTDRLIIKVRAWDVGGLPAGGVAHLTAPVGHFIGGDEVVLAEGFGTATYACSPDEEAACSGTVRLAAEWSGLRATTQVTVAAAATVAAVEWEVVSTRSLSKLVAIAVAPDDSVWAVGERGAVVKLVGREWQPMAAPTRVTLRAITFDARGKPVIVGDEGTVLRWLDGTLSRLPLGDDVDSYRAVAVDGDGRVHVGSETGVLSMLEGDALVPKLDLRSPILAMAAQEREVWATADGMLARYSAEGWLNLPMPLTARLTVAHSGRDGLWLGGERQGATSVAGVIVSGPSPTWKTTALPEPVVGFTEVPGVEERFALTGQSLFRQWEGAAWARVEVPAQVTAMASRGRGDLVLVGPAGFSLLRR
jgi:hypothetical protein